MTIILSHSSEKAGVARLALGSRASSRSAFALVVLPIESSRLVDLSFSSFREGCQILAALTASVVVARLRF